MAGAVRDEADQLPPRPGARAAQGPALVQKVALDFASGVGSYQIVYADPYQILAPYHEALVDLNTMMKDPDLPKLDDVGDFIPTQLDAAGKFVDKDKLYALPYDAPTMIWQYRKDLFEAADPEQLAQVGAVGDHGEGDVALDQRAVEQDQRADPRGVQEVERAHVEDQRDPTPLDPGEGLSPGQREAIDRVCREHADLADDAFVAEHLTRWLE